MSSLKYFGTDGIRGPFGGPFINEAMAQRVGRAAGRFARRLTNGEPPVLLIGRDTRSSGLALQASLAAGFHAEGGTTICIGVAPTPGIAKAASLVDATLACAITASHNPYTDNGLKFFQGSGVKLDAEMELELDSEIDGSEPLVDMVSLADAENAKALQGYVDAIAALFPGEFLKGKRVALDCANGAMHAIAPKLFTRFGALVDVVGCEPDGDNINRDVGSECPQALQALYRNSNYDFGFAFDGDGDRVIAFDELGQRIDGEATMAVLALDALDRNRLPKSTLVTTAQSNLGLEAVLKPRGINVERVDIGDKHVIRRMVAEGYSLGGEESGHLVLGSFSMTGDGLLAALALAEIACGSKGPLSVLAASYQAFPQRSDSVRVAEKRPLEGCSHLQSTMNDVMADFGDKGRLLVRYSGTEPKLRLLVEAQNDAAVEKAMAMLKAAAAVDLELV